VLEEDHRIVVREGDAATAERARRVRDPFRRRRVRQRVDLAGLADVPVLTESTGEIAARGAEGQDGRARQEVVERLLLDRVHTEAARAPEGGEDDGVVLAGADEAEAALPLVELARARADVALHVAARQPMPVAGWNDGFDHIVTATGLP